MQHHKEKSFSFLYATREKYPTFRVDLTELISNGFATKGYKIDWHMQSMEKAASTLLCLNENERIFLGTAISGSNTFNKVLNQFSAFVHDLKLFYTIRKSCYDFVQVRDKMFASLVSLISAKIQKIPIFYWMSFPYPEADVFRAKDLTNDLHLTKRAFYCLRGFATGWLLYHVILPRVDHIFVQSDQMKKDVASRGIKLEMMTPVPMGINFDRVKETYFQPISDPKVVERFPLVYVGTMTRVRRIDFLIQMIKLVREKVPEAILILVGDASQNDMDFLKNEAARLGVTKHVIFTGFLPIEKAWAHIRMARVCLSPFRPSPILNSTSPTKIVEYLALGRPVVANNHPDQSTVLGHSGAGYAVDFMPEAFSRAVIDLLLNPSKAEAMGQLGIEYVRQHRSYTFLSEKLENKYYELLNPKSGPLTDEVFE